MSFFRQWGEFMMMGARAFAKWDIDNSNRILRDHKRLITLGLSIIPIIIVGIAFADEIGGALPI